MSGMMGHLRQRILNNWGMGHMTRTSHMIQTTRITTCMVNRLVHVTWTQLKLSLAKLRMAMCKLAHWR